MAFPKNNLPVDSLLWGREVEKRVENIETSFTSAQINNSSRDSQLLSNFQRLDVAVADLIVTTATANQAASDAITAASAAQTAADDAAAAAQTALDAIDGLTGLGEATGSAYTINANNINAGTINASVVTVTNLSATNITTGTLTGRTVRTASSGRRAELGGTLASGLAFFDQAGSNSGTLSASNTDRSAELRLENSTGAGVFIYNGGADLVGPGTTISAGNNGNSTAAITSSSTVDITGDGGLKLNAGNTTATGIYLNNYTYYPPGASIAAATVSAIGIDVNNLIRRSSSSIRYKTEVEPMNIDYQRWIEMPLVTYKYKQDIQDLGNYAPVLNGYIAEELHELGYTDLVLYEKDEAGNFIPEGVNTNSLAAGTHAVVQKQAKIIQDLSARLEALEARLSELENRV